VRARVPASSISGVVVSLARVEGRRSLVHPFFLAGLGFALIGSGLFIRASLTRSQVTWGDQGWTVSVGFAVLAILTMMGANHAALRDRRERTEEQHSMLPAGAPARTVGLLTAMLWPAVVTAMLLAGVAGFAAARGILIGGVEAVHLLERVVDVLTFGALGIAIAAWLPSPFVVPLVGWAMFLFTPSERPASWHAIAPFVNLRSSELAMWHVAYLIGLTAIFASVALARSSARLPSVLASGVIGIGIVATSAVILLTSACPAHGPCLLG